jgi:hypothetical protein
LALKVYVDESLRTEIGLCVVAAVVLDETQEIAARADLAAILPPGARRLHWQSDSTVIRQQIMQVLAKHAHFASVYLSHFDDNKRGDAARAQCLSHLYADMGGRPYSHIILDQRTRHQDTRDLVLFTQQCKRLNLPNPPEVTHDGTMTESLLWLADAVAGAAGEHIVNKDAAYIQVMAHKLAIM